MIIFLQLRAWLRRVVALARQHGMLLWAAVVGLLGALATLAFREGLTGAQDVLVGHSGSFVEMARALPWQYRLLLPCAGGALAGAFLLFARRAESAKSLDYMEAIAIGEGHISVPHTLLRSLSSLATIASGGSIGREGSMVQLAALCASVLGRGLRFDAAKLRLLVACGAAAGIAAAYNAPIAGAFFVTEIVLGAIVMESFGPVVIAAVVANITMRALPGYHATYEMPAFPVIPSREVLLFLLLGGLAGLLTPRFLQLIALFKGWFQRAALPLPLQLGGGGLLVGLLSIWVPEVYGNGYSVVNSLLHQHWLWSAVLMVLLFKVVATALTVGSGAVGGVFTPTLFVGAATGTLFAQAVHALWPGLAAGSFAYAMVGMGAFLAAATGAPLMAIFMIFEMTLSYQIMLPLMLACVFSYFVVRSIDGASMYEITARRARHEKALFRLRATQMAELIQPAVTVLPLTAGFDAASRMFLLHPVKYIYMVDQAMRFQGVVALQDITAALLEPGADAGRSLTQFLRRDFLHVVTPDMTLDEALQHFLQHQGERLPVIRSSADPVLLGVIYKTALLDAYSRLIRSSLAAD
ncbi:CIC family chloride channel protein [Oxalobacteraceae bacterium GrIS 1.11]